MNCVCKKEKPFKAATVFEADEKQASCSSTGLLHPSSQLLTLCFWDQMREQPLQLPLNEVSAASSSQASVTKASSIFFTGFSYSHTDKTWPQLSFGNWSDDNSQWPFAFFKSLSFLSQSQSDAKQIWCGHFSHFCILPLWPEQMFLLLMPSKYIKSNSVFSAALNCLSFSEMYFASWFDSIWFIFYLHILPLKSKRP